MCLCVDHHEAWVTGTALWTRIGTASSVITISEWWELLLGILRRPPFSVGTSSFPDARPSIMSTSLSCLRCHSKLLDGSHSTRSLFRLVSRAGRPFLPPFRRAVTPEVACLSTGPARWPSVVSCCGGWRRRSAKNVPALACRSRGAVATSAASNSRLWLRSLRIFHLSPILAAALGLFLLLRRRVHGPLPYWCVALSSRHGHSKWSGLLRQKFHAQIFRRPGPFSAEYGMLPPGCGHRSDSRAPQQLIFTSPQWGRYVECVRQAHSRRLSDVRPCRRVSSRCVLLRFRTGVGTQLMMSIRRI
jgi:hypothetical protein